MRGIILVLMVLVLVVVGCLGIFSFGIYFNFFNYLFVLRIMVVIVLEEKCVCNVLSDFSKEFFDFKIKVEFLNVSLRECCSNVFFLKYLFNVI